MPGSWRRWFPGPKNGPARSVAVFGSTSPPDPDQLLELLGQCEELRAWARERNIVLNDSPGSLDLLDREIETWNGNPAIGARLGNDVGCYLGTVIVKNVPGAAWRIWPNGHPVVRTRSGHDVDVAARANQVLANRCTLTSIYTNSQ